MPRKMKVAVAQFPVSGDIAKNLKYYIKFINDAKTKNVDLIAFSELSLCGFGPVDWTHWKDVNYAQLEDAETDIRNTLKKLKLWAVIGTARPNGPRKKPFNSAVFIDPKGNDQLQYDKIFGTTAELEHYAKGTHFDDITIKRIKFGSLICYDFRFPELYRHYFDRNVDVMVHPFYQTGKPPYKKGLAHIGPIHAQSRASENCMAILAPNCACKNAAWGSMIINPDGEPLVQLPRGKTAMGIADIDIDAFRKGWPEIRRQNAKRVARGSLNPLTQSEAKRYL